MFGGEKTLPALEAAHIKPFSQQGPNKVHNGLLLRSDLHRLFDRGYLTVTTKYDIEVSKKIKEEFKNGREYYAFHGKPLIVTPQNSSDQPSKEFLEWHNDCVYRN